VIDPAGWSRRALLRAAAVAFLASGVGRTGVAGSAPRYAPVLPGAPLRFPHDHGSHPAFRTEWWYVTGWVDHAAEPLGFQVTFFRTSRSVDPGNPSAFAPREILLAHAAVSQAGHGRLRHADRILRAGFGLAGAATGRAHTWLDDWGLEQAIDDDRQFRTVVSAPSFGLDLSLQATRPPLLHGEAGFSQKGPDPLSASYYYSLPHLAVAGRLRLGQRTLPIRGRAWFDHEWSSEIMDAEAIGWDWIGINLDDGGSLMAFRMRGRSTPRHWAGGTWTRADGTRQTFGPSDIAWVPLSHWQSPRTGTRYPVAFRVTAGVLTVDIEPLMPDQENDARRSAGTVYWEGAVRAVAGGRQIGTGYLELTGYWRPLRLG
jgi:predicted secreted hydrolase